VVAAVFGVEDEQALATRAISATATTIQVRVTMGLASAASPVAIDRVRLKASTIPPLVSPVTGPSPRSVSMS